MPHSDRQGFVLLTAMAVLASFMALSTVALSRSVGEFSAASRQAARLQAFHLADAAIDCALAQLRVTADPAAIQAACTLTPAAGRTASLIAMTPQAADHWAVTSRGFNAATNDEVLLSAVLVGGGLLRHFALIDGPVFLTGGQGMLFDAGDGPLYIGGRLEISPGGSTVAAARAAKEFTLTTNSTMEIDGYIYDRRNPANFATLADITLNTKRFPKNDPMPPVNTELRVGDWIDFLRLAPGPDLSGRVMERNTGARPIGVAFPALSDIETYADAMAAQAPQYVVNSAADLPCGAGQPVRFANTKTRALVDAVEIDVQVLNGCLTQPTLIHATVPLRLAHGEQLAQPLTVVSDGAVYLKGDFNTIGTKPAAVVTRNRVYNLSRTYFDYGVFYPTPAPGVPLNLAAYNAYQAAFAAAPANAKPAPPVAGWHAAYAEDTTQKVAIVAPVQSNATDNVLIQNTALLEDWYQAPGYQWAGQTVYLPPAKLADARRRLLSLHGAFIQLRDANPGDNDNKSPLMPQNRWIFNEPQHAMHYSEAVTNPPPPGFGDSPKQVYWAQAN